MLNFVRAKELYLLLVMSLVTGQGTPGRQDFRRILRMIFVRLVIIVTGCRRQASTLHWRIVRPLVNVEVQGIGRMGLRGRIGHRLVQEKKLKMLITRWVLVKETKQGVVVQRVGLETRLRARRHEGRPAVAGAD